MNEAYYYNFLTDHFYSHANTRSGALACLDDEKLWDIYQFCAIIVEHPKNEIIS